MAAGSALRKGFEAVGRQPALVLAEITWRWCFAAGAWLLAGLTLLEYLNSVPVSWREQLLMEGGGPLLALAALGHALRGSAGRLAAGVVLAGTAVAILWMLGAALGRLVTLKALLADGCGAYRPMLGLSFLRAGLFLAAALGAGGALILAHFAARPGDATASTILAVVLIACIWVVWALLNWLLSLASVFVVRDGEDALGGVAAAVEFAHARLGEVVLSSLPFVLLHYVALAAAVASGILIFDLMMQMSAGAGWALVAVAAGYFAYTDFLYISRLAAYVALVEPGGEYVKQAAPEPVLPSSMAGASDD